MGLSVVKQFIDDLQGEIHLESDVGKGSTFICLIPFQVSLLSKLSDHLNRGVYTVFDSNRDKPQKVKEDNVVSPCTTTQQNSVLLVEDNQIAAKVAKNILSEQGCLVDIAPDGQAALKQLEKNTYHLVLMDVGLPDEDGCEVTRQIRVKQAKKNLWVPIIGITAHVAVEKKQRCLASGMNAIYSKPLTSKKLEEILNTFVLAQPPLLSEISEAYVDTLQSIPLLDLDSALNLVGDRKFITECLRLLIKELNADLPWMKQQYKAKNWPAMKDRVHKWKGGASYCGARRLMAACQKLYLVLGHSPVAVQSVTTLYEQLLQVVDQTQHVAQKAIDSK